MASVGTYFTPGQGNLYALGYQNGYESATQSQVNSCNQLMGPPRPECGCAGVPFQQMCQGNMGAMFMPQMMGMMMQMMQMMQMQMMQGGGTGQGCCVPPQYQMPCQPPQGQCPPPYPQSPYGGNPGWGSCYPNPPQCNCPCPPYPCPRPCPPPPPECWEPGRGCIEPPRHGGHHGCCPAPGETNKMWDVWFDSKDGQKTVQRSPIVLDLNKNGKADITGKNITGDGKIDGPTTMFDLDPNNVSYEFKSQQRRPGSGAPAVKGGYWVDAEGNRAKSGPPKGTQPKFNGYEYRDKDGAVVGEMKDGLYNYGKQENREQTEWLKKGGGDGFLVADLNGDGQINNATELFGTEGTKGSKYKNGYEKLAALYDKNQDGRVSGRELQGLQVWADANADGKVQAGELQSLQQHNITSFNVGNYDGKTMEGSYTVGGGHGYFPSCRGARPGYYN